MNKQIIKTLMLLFLACFVGFACGKKDQGKPEEKGAIEEMTDNAAKKAADKMMAPVDRAKDARDLGQKHINDLEKKLDE